VFFEADDYRLYRRLVAAAWRAGAAVWAYCLMPNHGHLPIMPSWHDAGGCGRVASDLCRSAPALHRGHQRSVPLDGPSVSGPLGAVVMGEPHLLAATRYVALNPVVAGLMSRSEDWPWSRTRAQLAGEDDEFATVAPLRALIPDFSALLAMPTDAAAKTRIEHAPTIARLGGQNGSRCSSAGSAALWHPRRPGPKPGVEQDTARQAQLL